MFTGIVEEVGEVLSVQKTEKRAKMIIHAKKILENSRVGDSLNIDGVCQTITSISSLRFTVDSEAETLKKTTFGTFKRGRRVNLERSLTLNLPLGGHIVQGHVNGTGTLSEILKRDESIYLKVLLPHPLKYYCIREGSIALDGMSLTIADISSSDIIINIVPHTFQNTTLPYKRPKDTLNVEVDIIARYVRHFLDAPQPGEVSMAMLKNWGYE